MGKRKSKQHQHDAAGVKKQCTPKAKGNAHVPAHVVFQNYKTWNEIPVDVQCRADVAKIAIDKQWVKHISEFPEKLQQDEKFRRFCIIKGFNQRCHSKKIKTYCDSDYKELPTKWKEDRDVILAAFRYERATLKDIPESFLSDDEFLRRTVHEHPRFFSEMPPHIRDDIKYWLSGELTERLVDEILDAHPTVGEDTEFWDEILVNKPFGPYIYGEWVEQYAPERLQLNHEFMWTAMEGFVSTWLQEYSGLFNLPILQDKTFVAKLYQDLEDDDLEYIPKEVQLRFPDLVAELLIPRVLEEDVDEEDECNLVQVVAGSLASELWNNMDIVKAWFSNDGRFVEDALPQTWNLDPKGFLWIAENCDEADFIQSFERAPAMLLDDKSFMMQAIKLQPKLYQAASRQLQDDIDLRMMVCSKVSTMDDLLSCGMSADVVKRTHEHIQERYKAYQGFETFRSCVSHHGTTAPIMLMNQGPTTSVAYNSLFAEYLGVPTGEELEMVRACAEKIGIA